MPISIHTRYLPATDTRGARIKASTRAPGGRIESVIISYDHEGSEHEKAAHALRARHWPDLPMFRAGETLDGRGYVFTIAPQEV